MAVNTQAPFGLQAIKYLNGALWNGQVSQYKIQSGYSNNIFRGDPVIIGIPPGGVGGGVDGHVMSLANVATGTYPGNATAPIQNTPILGVFVGCSYQQEPSLNPIDPASPGRSYWPAGTQTLGNADAIAYVIDDPNVVYAIQANGPTSASDAFNYSYVEFNYSASPITLGNFQTGQSTAFMEATTLSTALLPAPATAGTTYPFTLRTLRFAQPSGLAENVDGASFNIWEVVIENHYFAARSPV